MAQMMQIRTKNSAGGWDTKEVDPKAVYVDEYPADAEMTYIRENGDLIDVPIKDIPKVPKNVLPYYVPAKEADAEKPPEIEADQTGLSWYDRADQAAGKALTAGEEALSTATLGASSLFTVLPRAADIAVNEGISGAYGKAREIQQAEFDQYRQENPLKSVAASTAASFIPVVGLLGKLGTAGKIIGTAVTADSAAIQAAANVGEWLPALAAKIGVPVEKYAQAFSNAFKANPTAEGFKAFINRTANTVQAKNALSDVAKLGATAAVIPVVSRSSQVVQSAVEKAGTPNESIEYGTPYKDLGVNWETAGQALPLVVPGAYTAKSIAQGVASGTAGFLGKGVSTKQAVQSLAADAPVMKALAEVPPEQRFMDNLVGTEVAAKQLYDAVKDPNTGEYLVVKNKLESRMGAALEAAKSSVKMWKDTAKKVASADSEKLRNRGNELKDANADITAYKAMIDELVLQKNILDKGFEKESNQLVKQRIKEIDTLVKESAKELKVLEQGIKDDLRGKYRDDIGGITRASIESMQAAGNPDQPIPFGSKQSGGRPSRFSMSIKLANDTENGFKQEFIYTPGNKKIDGFLTDVTKYLRDGVQKDENLSAPSMQTFYSNAKDDILALAEKHNVGSSPEERLKIVSSLNKSLRNATANLMEKDILSYYSNPDKVRYIQSAVEDMRTAPVLFEESYGNNPARPGMGRRYVDRAQFINDELSKNYPDYASPNLDTHNTVNTAAKEARAEKDRLEKVTGATNNYLLDPNYVDNTVKQSNSLQDAITDNASKLYDAKMGEQALFDQKLEFEGKAAERKKAIDKGMSSARTQLDNTAAKFTSLQDNLDGIYKQGAANVDGNIEKFIANAKANGEYEVIKHLFDTPEKLEILREKMRISAAIWDRSKGADVASPKAMSTLQDNINLLDNSVLGDQMRRSLNITNAQDPLLETYRRTSKNYEPLAKAAEQLRGYSNPRPTGEKSDIDTSRSAKQYLQEYAYGREQARQAQTETGSSNTVPSALAAAVYRGSRMTEKDQKMETRRLNTFRAALKLILSHYSGTKSIPKSVFNNLVTRYSDLDLSEYAKDMKNLGYTIGD